jgi:hypothetical protein
MCESVGKGDGYSKEEKNTQCAGTPFVVVGDGATAADRLHTVEVQSHAVADGEQGDDGEGPGGGQSGGVTKVEQGSSDTADDDTELELPYILVHIQKVETEMLTHDKNVRSAAKKTLGSTRTGT